MYEYAATVMGPSNSGANSRATYMDVGPSAAPMMPIDAACLRVKAGMKLAYLLSLPRYRAAIRVAKMPNCAAAPKNSMNGRLSRGAKSIIAPTAMKMRIGNNSFSMPAL